MFADAADKRVSMDEALGVLDPGGIVGLGGMMLYRRPVAFCRAVKASGLSELTVVTFSAAVETELLVGGGTVDTLRTCYAGLEMFGPAPAVRAAVGSGEVRLVDETELTLAAGLQAAALGLPWLPSAEGVLDTDYVRVRDDLVEFDDAISGRRLLALPAIELDACVLHVPFADPAGNAVFSSSPTLDREMACASDIVIVTAEEVVDTDTLLARCGQVDLLGFQTTFVVEVAGGAHPTACHPHYGYDGEALCDYLEATGA